MNRQRLRFLGAVLAALVMLSGLGGCCPKYEVLLRRFESYVQHVNPKLRHYIDNDPTLSEEQKRIQRRTLDDNEEFLKKAREGLDQ